MRAQPVACDVLLVDDSAVARAVFARALEESGDFAVTGAVATASAALRFLASNRVDFILLDIHMPGVDGLTALPDLAIAAPHAHIVVVSSAAAGVQALALGAADALTKPAPGESGMSFARTLVDTLIGLRDGAAVPLGPASTPTASAVDEGMGVLGAATPAGSRRLPVAGEDHFEIMAIGASTGGIHALGHLLREIPVTSRMPILVTQHLPASFMPYFAAQLSLLAGRPCDVATDRLRVRPGRLIVAPGDAHIECVRLSDGGAAIRLSRDASRSGCMPSVDYMLSSAATVFGDRLLAVVLSGMGRDGAEGAAEVHRQGGYVVVQDRATSVVWGMPGAVASQGIADAVLPPDAIGRLAVGRRRS